MAFGRGGRTVREERRGRVPFGRSERGGRGGSGRGAGSGGESGRAPIRVPCMCARLSPSTVTVTPDLVSDWISRSSFASLLVSIAQAGG